MINNINNKLKTFVILLFVFNIAYGQITDPDGGDDLQLPPSICTSFKPIPGHKYIISGWLKEDRAEQVISYTTSGFKITFSAASSDQEYIFKASGDIIDGWQRFTGIFEVPQDALAIQIGFVSAELGVTTYFDDIRIHPFNGNMKSFVYDQDTQRLLAELDENNYATLYEYDHEGGLVRVKKETKEGIYTIQETRSGNSKLNTQQ